MVLSNKIQFAFLAIFDLVHNKELGSITLADIAKRQNVSISYLEQIFSKLKKAGVVESVRGPGGGYKITDTGMYSSVQDIINIIGTNRAQYYRSKKEQWISSAPKTSLASLDGFIYRHLKSLSVREAIKLI